MTQPRGAGITGASDSIMEVFYMDSRLQHIIDNFDNMKLGADDTFKFSCKQCGKCCINREDILLNAQDVYRLSKELRMKPLDMINEYGEVYIGSSSRVPIVRLRPRGFIRRCRFLKDRKCSVHQAKPTVCAMYPLGRAMVFKNAEGEQPDYMTGEIQFIINNHDCGTDETHTVREWFADFGIELDDLFYRKWNQAITRLSSIIYRAEDKSPDSTVEMMWNLAYALLYLHYDTEQEFMQQFEENAEELFNILRLAPSEQGGK